MGHKYVNNGLLTFQRHDFGKTSTLTFVKSFKHELDSQQKFKFVECTVFERSLPHPKKL